MLSKEFSRTENPILGALARLDNFLMNPLIQGHSGTTPEMSRNAFITNQGTNEDDSPSEPHPEAGIFGNQTMQNSGQEDQYTYIHTYIHIYIYTRRPIYIHTYIHTYIRTHTHIHTHTHARIDIIQHIDFDNFAIIFAVL